MHHLAALLRERLQLPLATVVPMPASAEEAAPETETESPP